MNLKKHLVNSTAVSGVATVACLGFIAFARRTAQIDPAFQPLQYTPVGVATLVSGYAAYSVFQLLKEYINRPYEFFMYLSGFVFIISYMPIGHLTLDMTGTGIAEINVLGTIHAIAATFIIGGIAKLEMMDRA